MTPAAHGYSKYSCLNNKALLRHPLRMPHVSISARRIAAILAVVHEITLGCPDAHNVQSVS